MSDHPLHRKGQSHDLLLLLEPPIFSFVIFDAASKSFEYDA